MMAEVIARLTAEVPALASVAGAVEFAALDGNPPVHLRPAAYVLPSRETAEANRRVGAHSQRVTEEFTVALALGNLSDARGDAAARELETLMAATRAALAGWIADADHTAVDYVRGQLLGLRDRVVWWGQTFRTARNEYLP